MAFDVVCSHPFTGFLWSICGPFIHFPKANWVLAVDCPPGQTGDSSTPVFPRAFAELGEELRDRHRHRIPIAQWSDPTRDTSFGTRGSQVQILPLRPVFKSRSALRGLIWGTKRAHAEFFLDDFRWVG